MNDLNEEQVFPLIICLNILLSYSQYAILYREIYV